MFPFLSKKKNVVSGKQWHQECEETKKREILKKVTNMKSKKQWHQKEEKKKRQCSWVTTKTLDKNSKITNFNECETKFSTRSKTYQVKINTQSENHQKKWNGLE